MKLSEWAEPHGRQTELAVALSAQPQLVGQWAKGDRPIPIDRRPAIEAATRGAVRCEEMFPAQGQDAVWQRVSDAKWPWHPKGRPLLDVVRTDKLPPVLIDGRVRKAARTAGARRKADRPRLVTG